MYPWFQQTQKLLTSSIAANKLAHGILLDSPEGSGKLEFGFNLAKSLLCNQSDDSLNPCNQCKNCQLFEAESHPDFYFLDRLVDNKGKAKQSIGIDQVRELTDKLSAAPQLGGWRIALIRSVSDLTTASFNALLKTLEEPGKQTLLLLLSHNIQKVPSTIRSRCQVVGAELTKQKVITWLSEQTSAVSEEDLGIVLNDAANAPLKALELIEGDYLKKKATFARAMHDLFICKQTPDQVMQSIELNELTWVLLANYLQSVILNKTNKSASNPAFARLEPSLVFELYDEVTSYQRAIFAGSNLQAKLQFQAILIKWFETGRKIIHYSMS